MQKFSADIFLFLQKATNIGIFKQTFRQTLFQTANCACLQSVSGNLDMENLYILKWEKNSADKKHLAIYKDNILFGSIPNMDFTGIANINNNFFCLETEGSWLNRKTYISDPKNKTKLCQVILYSDRSYHLEVDQKSKYKLTGGMYNNNEKCFVEITNDRTFIFSKSGTIKIYSDKDIELLIYCGFYARTLSSAE